MSEITEERIKNERNYYKAKSCMLELELRDISERFEKVQDSKDKLEENFEFIVTVLNDYLEQLNELKDLNVEVVETVNSYNADPEIAKKAIVCCTTAGQIRNRLKHLLIEANQRDS